MELLLQFLAELFVQLFAEFVVNCLAHAFSKERRVIGSNPILAGIGYVLAGAFCGAISLAILHRPIFESLPSQVLALIGTTVAMGIFASALGQWRQKHGRGVLLIDRFLFGALFGFAFGIVRFFAA